MIQRAMLFTLLLGCANRSATIASPETHPGEITFIDHSTGETRISAASDVPETIAWATVDGEKVPIIRVESHVMGNRREIHRYGADGALVDSTVSAPR